MGRSAKEDPQHLGSMIGIDSEGNTKELNLRQPRVKERTPSLLEDLKQSFKSEKQKKLEAEGEQSLRETHYL